MNIHERIPCTEIIVYTSEYKLSIQNRGKLELSKDNKIQDAASSISTLLNTLGPVVGKPLEANCSRETISATETQFDSQNNFIGNTYQDLKQLNSLNHKVISTYLFITASKSWTSIAIALKIMPNTYNQKFWTLIFLEGRFLIIAYRKQRKYQNKAE